LGCSDEKNIHKMGKNQTKPKRRPTILKTIFCLRLAAPITL